MDSCADRTLEFDNGVSVVLPFRARAVRRTADVVLVLLDPDHYLNDATHKAAQDSGELPLRNLVAFDRQGNKTWVAELPEAVDYYHSIEEGLPIRAHSYSGHRCLIDERTGRITRREFLG